MIIIMIMPDLDLNISLRISLTTSGLPSCTDSDKAVTPLRYKWCVVLWQS